MNHPRARILACLVLASLSALAAASSPAAGASASAARPTLGDRIQFSAAPNLRLAKTLTTKHELALVESGGMIDDGPLVSDGAAGWVSSWQKTGLEDEYLAVADGRPTLVRRTYKEVRAGGSANIARGRGKKTQEKSASGSPLEGHTVVFTWVPEEKSYSRTYDRLEADEEWLAYVEGDMDFLGLLPPGEVGVGDTWPIEPQALRDVLAPGGSLQLTPRGSNPFGRLMKVGVGGDFADVIGKDIGGTAQCTYKGMRDVDGAQLAVIELELDMVTQRDRTALYRTAMPIAEKRDPDKLQRVVVEYAVQGKAELLWDVAAGHFRSFDLNANEHYTATVVKISARGVEAHEASNRTTFTGTLAFQLVTSAPAVGPLPQEHAVKPPPVAGGEKGK